MKNLLILGSGRSGTSMLAGSLASAGYFFGRNPHYLGKNKSNLKGFYEDFEVNTINEDILKLSLPIIPEKLRKIVFPSYTFYRARWLARLPLNRKINTTEEIQHRIKTIVLNEPFCLKDPRFCYTLPVWEKHLNSATRYVVIFRDPAQTAASILRESKESPGLKNLRVTRKIALQVWKSTYSHVIKNFHKSSRQKDWFFLHFDQMFDPEVVRKLEVFLEAKIDIEFPEKRISRTRDVVPDYSADVKFLYLQLSKLANYYKVV